MLTDSWFLAAEDVFDLLRYLLPYLIVIIIGGLGLAKKAFETYVEREKQRARTEGRPVKSPFSSLRDYLESLEQQRSGSPAQPKEKAPRPNTSWDPEIESAARRAVQTVKDKPAARPSQPVGKPPAREPVGTGRGRGRARAVPARRVLEADPNYLERVRGGRQIALLRRPGSLRQMVVLSEVFGPPVALREDLAGCPGLRPPPRSDPASP